MSQTKILPVILAGGVGTRLWPVSRKAYPKQFINLVRDSSLYQQSVMRVAHEGFYAPLVLVNEVHRFLAAEQLREHAIDPMALLLEPSARNTAPAALVSALYAKHEHGGDTLILLQPSDHLILDEAAFRDSIRDGVRAAESGDIVTFGIKPDRPETGYGYIETRGNSSADTPALEVLRFVEKPDQPTAETYLARGNFYWNAGIFMTSADTMITAFQAHAPQLLAPCEAAVASAQDDLDFVRLDQDAFDKADSISIDYAVMEHATNIRCVPLKSDWSDLGAWSALHEAMDKDATGNAGAGDVKFQDSENCLAFSEDGASLSLVGMKNCIAIATKDAVLITEQGRSQDVSKLVKQLDSEGRRETVYHRRVYRPWGWFEGLSDGDRFQVKSLRVNPGATLSLQSHHHRAEHWVVVSGTAEVTVDGAVTLLTENQSTYIPLGAVHRLANPGKLPALLIEVQSGGYLGEDDIVRYDDVYGRKGEVQQPLDQKSKTE